jgi:hypothetical protein
VDTIETDIYRVRYTWYMDRIVTDIYRVRYTWYIGGQNGDYYFNSIAM